MRKWVYLFFSVCAVFLASCSRYQGPELKTVPSVDLSKYLGTWYEVASLPAWFEKKCVSDVSAQYSLVDGGKIKVLNSCKIKDGSITSDEGRGFPQDTTNSKLKVTFVKSCFKSGCMTGDYWIMDLDQGYRFALVGSPDRKYLWILSRTPAMLAQKDYQRLTDLATNQGFDITELILRF